MAQPWWSSRSKHTPSDTPVVSSLGGPRARVLFNCTTRGMGRIQDGDDDGMGWCGTSTVGGTLLCAHQIGRGGGGCSGVQGRLLLLDLDGGGGRRGT